MLLSQRRKGVGFGEVEGEKFVLFIGEMVVEIHYGVGEFMAIHHS